MPFIVIVLVLSIGLGVFLTRKYHNKVLIIWGVITMLSIAPFFSWIVAMIVAVNVGDGFAGVAVMWLMFPVLFLIGVGMVGAGVYKKVTGENL
jgi:UDP-N-acetylmuramyl pentapeptide phosphotransferase/UDP-N-acetylglucosamine-1-phosphate transferase